MPGDKNGDEFMLPESDVRAIVRLLADVAATPGGVMAQKRRLIEGIAELTQTEYWMWNVTRLEEGKPPTAVSILHNFSDKQLAVIADANYSGASAAIDERMTALGVSGKHQTRQLFQLIPRNEYDDLPVARVFREQVGLTGESLFTYFPVPHEDQMISAIGLHRAEGREPYTQREARLLHILTSEVAWLHENSMPEEDGRQTASLSPRLQTVLTMLIDGQSAKRIAFNLDLSEHTVRGYVKDIYRHFQVSSRAELMRRFMVGDGGDVPSA